VTVTATAGRTPQLNPPTVTPLLTGDAYVNTADRTAWLYDGATWVSIVTPPARQTVIEFGIATADHAGTPAAAPTGPHQRLFDALTGNVYRANAAGTAWEAAPARTLVAGDRFIDLVNNDVYEVK
jgi:hypothetical protein